VLCGLCERLHFLLKSIQKICEDHLYKKLQSGLNFVEYQVIKGIDINIVNRRFKGNGMRWKKSDNESVLEVRLAVFNETLEQAFEPTP
jgi:hypothetical protein